MAAVPSVDARIPAQRRKQLAAFLSGQAQQRTGAAQKLQAIGLRTGGSRGGGGRPFFPGRLGQQNQFVHGEIPPWMKPGLGVIGKMPGLFQGPAPHWQGPGFDDSGDGGGFPGLPPVMPPPPPVLNPGMFPPPAGPSGPVWGGGGSPFDSSGPSGPVWGGGGNPLGGGGPSAPIWGGGPNPFGWLPLPPPPKAWGQIY